MRQYFIKAYENARSTISSMIAGLIITEQHKADGTFEILVEMNESLLNDQLSKLEMYCNSIKEIA